MRTNTTESARVSKQCAISLELVDPKRYLNRVPRKGNWLIFQYLHNVLEPYGSLPDRESITIVISNRSRTGECRNDENRSESGTASRQRGFLESRRP